MVFSPQFWREKSPETSHCLSVIMSNVKSFNHIMGKCVGLSSVWGSNILWWFPDSCAEKGFNIRIPGCATLASGLFWTEENQDPADFFFKVYAPLYWLKEFRQRTWSKKRAVSTDDHEGYRVSVVTGVSRTGYGDQIPPHVPISAGPANPGSPNICSSTFLWALWLLFGVPDPCTLLLIQRHVNLSGHVNLRGLTVWGFKSYGTLYIHN